MPARGPPSAPPALPGALTPPVRAELHGPVPVPAAEQDRHGLWLHQRQGAPPAACCCRRLLAAAAGCLLLRPAAVAASCRCSAGAGLPPRPARGALLGREAPACGASAAGGGNTPPPHPPPHPRALLCPAADLDPGGGQPDGARGAGRGRGDQAVHQLARWVACAPAARRPGTLAPGWRRAHAAHAAGAHRRAPAPARRCCRRLALRGSGHR